MIFLPIYYEPAATILKQAKDNDYAPTFFGVDGMDGILTMDNFDTSLAEGVLLLTPFSADAEDERPRNLFQRIRKNTAKLLTSLQQTDMMRFISSTMLSKIQAAQWICPLRISAQL